MRGRELDDFLAEALKGHPFFSPDFSNADLPAEKAVNPPRFIPINLPANGEMHTGRQLTQGELKLDHVLPESAVILMTEDFSLVHIDAKGNVTLKNNNGKTSQGTLSTDTPPLERDKPLTLTLSDPTTQAAFLFTPGTKIVDVIVYNPQPQLQRDPRRPRRPMLTNMYSPLLQRFVK